MGHCHMRKVGRRSFIFKLSCIFTPSYLRHYFLISDSRSLGEMLESTDNQVSRSKAASINTEPPKKFPKGVVLGKDGKP
jgi:hypothetical protein